MSASGGAAAVAGAPPSMMSREMVASLSCVALMFAGLYLVLGVIPIAVRTATGRTSETGLVTAALAFATIVTNLVTPSLMSRRSPSRLLTGSLLVATAGTVFLAAGDRSFALLLVGGTIQGLGLGVSLVVGVALIAALAPPERRSVAVGIYGVAAGVPAVVMPSLGLWLSSTFSLRTALGAATVASGLAAAASVTIPRAVAVELGTTHGIRAALAAPAVLALFLAFTVVMFAFGAVLTVIPLSLPKVGLRSAATFLLAMGIARVASRPVTGLLGTRMRNDRLYVPGLLAGVGGAALFALSRTPAAVLAAAVLLGLGFGSFQNASFVGMLEGVAHRDDGAVSSLWNFAFDTGVGLGAITAGAVAGSFGYAPVRWLLPAAMALALVAVVPARGRPR